MPFAWKFTFTARNSKGKATSRRTFAIQAPPFTISSNWAGYIVPSNGLVTEASGRFVVPTLNCSKTPNAGVSVWVGTGAAGPGTGDLLQTGVRSDCVGGTQDNNPGWWEEFPELPEIDFTGMSISPGDTIEAGVWQNSDGSWSTRLDDLTTGVSGVMTTGDAYGTVLDSDPTVWLDQEGSTSSVSYAGGSTAEWIVEDFENASTGQQVPFADFGTVTFSGLTTSLSSWSLTPDEQSGVGDANGYLYAAPSAPSGDGFSVTYTGP
jgi:hypothetical protein